MNEGWGWWLECCLLKMRALTRFVWQTPATSLTLMAVVQILRAKSVGCRAGWCIMQGSICNRWRILKEIGAFRVQLDSCHCVSWPRLLWAPWELGFLLFFGYFSFSCLLGLSFSHTMVLSFCLFIRLAVMRGKRNCGGKAKSESEEEADT